MVSGQSAVIGLIAGEVAGTIVNLCDAQKNPRLARRTVGLIAKTTMSDEDDVASLLQRLAQQKHLLQAGAALIAGGITATITLDLLGGSIVLIETAMYALGTDPAALTNSLISLIPETSSKSGFVNK